MRLAITNVHACCLDRAGQKIAVLLGDEPVVARKKTPRVGDYLLILVHLPPTLT